MIGNPGSTYDSKLGRWMSDSSLSEEDLNLLVRGDNLLSLKALEDTFTRRVKLVYIDPPFNTGAIINAEGEEVTYDDGLEHSIWLSMMKDRLEILRRFLANDGAIFVHIDDQEIGHLKVLLDEIFGPRNLITLITVKRSATTGHKSINPSPVNVADYILAYAKNKDRWVYKLQHLPREIDTAYNQFIENLEDAFSSWRFIPLSQAFASRSGFADLKAAKAGLAEEFGQEMEDFVLNNAERVIRFALPNYEGVSKEARKLIDESKEGRTKIFRLVRNGFSDMYFYRGNRILFYKDKLQEVDGKMTTGEPLTNLWTDIPFQGIANEGGVTFRKGKKPEKMMRRIIEMVTEPNDWVLDSFAGSGTTAAVAHKLGRRWVAIEIAKHAETHCLKRLQGVVSGSDQTGISKQVGWNGGGGFKYAVLGKSLFRKGHDNILEVEYDNGDLIEAVCKVEGFRFVGREFLSKTKLHGSIVNGKRFCHVTEELVTRDYVDDISTEISPEESIVLYCLKHVSKLGPPPNVQLRKIPREIAKRFRFD
jgi:adenine-specific DNA-methyltransferase